MAMHTIVAKTKSPVSMCLNLQRKCLEITFVCALNIPKNMQHKYSQSSTECRFRLSSRLEWIQAMFERHSSSNGKDLVITTEYPPSYYRQRSNMQSTFESPTDWSEHPTWLRQTDIMHHDDRVMQRTRPLSIVKDAAVIDIGEPKRFYSM